MTIDLTQIILAIITLVGGIVVRYLIPYLKEKSHFLCHEKNEGNRLFIL